MPPFAKREIKNSFIKLLTERPISQITVKDIVEDCGVNRNSFYYHFQDIPSLLEEIIVEMTAKVIETLPEESTFEEKVTAALEEINSNKRMIDGRWSTMPVIMKAYAADGWLGPQSMNYTYKLKWRI